MPVKIPCLRGDIMLYPIISQYILMIVGQINIYISVYGLFLIFPVTMPTGAYTWSSATPMYASHLKELTPRSITNGQQRAQLPLINHKYCWNPIFKGFYQFISNSKSIISHDKTQMIPMFVGEIVRYTMIYHLLVKIPFIPHKYWWIFQWY